MLEVSCWVLFPGAMAFAGSMDLVTMTIPNRISIVLVAGFFLLAPFVGMDVERFALHLGVGAAVLCCTFGLFALGWIGGGDAKIFAAASLWMGFDFIGEFAMLAALAGGVLTFALLAFRGLALPALLVQQDWIARLHHKATGVPYGIAIAAAALMVYPSTPWLMATAS